MINQKMIELKQEKSSLIFQINELYHIINLTKQNLTNTIHQLSNDNQRLQERVTALEHRLQVIEEQGSKEEETCPEGGDCTKINSTAIGCFTCHFNQTNRFNS